MLVEAVLSPNYQFLNPPIRPAYSKATLDGIFEKSTVESGIWTVV